MQPTPARSTPRSTPSTAPEPLAPEPPVRSSATRRVARWEQAFPLFRATSGRSLHRSDVEGGTDRFPLILNAGQRLVDGEPSPVGGRIEVAARCAGSGARGNWCIGGQHATTRAPIAGLRSRILSNWCIGGRYTTTAAPVGSSARSCDGLLRCRIEWSTSGPDQPIGVSDPFATFSYMTAHSWGAVVELAASQHGVLSHSQPLPSLPDPTYGPSPATASSSEQRPECCESPDRPPPGTNS